MHHVVLPRGRDTRTFPVARLDRVEVCWIVMRGYDIGDRFGGIGKSNSRVLATGDVLRTVRDEFVQPRLGGCFVALEGGNQLR